MIHIGKGKNRCENASKEGGDHSEGQTESNNVPNSDKYSVGYIDRLRMAQQSTPMAPDSEFFQEHDISAADDKRNRDFGVFVADAADAVDALDNNSKTDFSEYPVMPHEARRALVSLMRYGSVLAQSKKRLFEIVCQHQQAIRRHLSEVYLQLVLDERAGVAFIAGVDTEHVTERSSSADEGAAVELSDDNDTVTLITRRTLSLYDTLVLLVLRKHFQEREVAGEQKVMIGVESIESLMMPFLPLTNSERADRSKLQATVKRMVDKRLLAKIRGSEDRYEITPIIRYVVKAEFLESMLTEYCRLADELGVTLDSGSTEVMSNFVTTENSQQSKDEKS